MINLKFLRENFFECKNKILLKDPAFPVDDLASLDKHVLLCKEQLDALLCQSNVLAKSFSVLKNDLQARADAVKLSNDIEKKKDEYAQLKNHFDQLYLRCPNIVFDEVPFGDKNENRIIGQWGEKPQFSFAPLAHVDLVKNTGVIDFGKAAEIAKGGFVVYYEQAVDIMNQLVAFFFAYNRKQNFKKVAVPYVINKTALTAASNLPRFEEDLFSFADSNLYLIPTSETSLAFLHNDSILSEQELPLRYTCFTQCFRKEAGGYGANERGLMRIHQFGKVEIFSFCSAENSKKEHDFMLAHVEGILQLLQLHYRVMLLAAQDCSFASAKTYDIELWLSGQNQYREVSSISNCTDYQARRSATRYKKEGDSKTTQLVHTLNGSALALPRLLIALFEKYQLSNGKIDFDAISSLIEDATKRV